MVVDMTRLRVKGKIGSSELYTIASCHSDDEDDKWKVDDVSEANLKVSNN